MPADELKQFMHKIAQRSSPEREWKPSWRESLGAQMLGVLSVALGLVAVMKIDVTWFGFSCIAQSIDQWLSPPPERLAVAPTKPDASFERYCGLAVAGQFLGMAGVWIAMRMKRSSSPLSMIGIALCVIAILPMYVMLIVSSLVIVVPLLLPALAAMAINQYAKQR